MAIFNSFLYVYQRVNHTDTVKPRSPVRLKAGLVGGFKHLDYFPFHIWYVILPIGELHHFSRWLLQHQPEVVKRLRSSCFYTIQ